MFITVTRTYKGSRVLRTRLAYNDRMERSHRRMAEHHIKKADAHARRADAAAYRIYNALPHDVQESIEAEMKTAEKAKVEAAKAAATKDGTTRAGSIDSGRERLRRVEQRQIAKQLDPVPA